MSSRSTTLVIIALIAIACLIGFRYFVHNAYKAFPSGPNLDPMPAPRAEWKDYTSPTGKFQAKMPLVPQQASQSFTDPLTKQNRNYDMYVSQELDGTIYMISVITFQDKFLSDDPKTVFQAIINDMVKANRDNKLVSTKFDSYKNMPSAEFTIKNPVNTLEGKAFLNQQTLYVLTTIGNNKNYNVDDFNYFVKSFEIL